jgi:hypothetical protein
MGTVSTLPNSPKKKAKKSTGGGKPPKPPKEAKATGNAIVKLRSHAEAAKDPKVAQSALEAIEEIQKNWSKWQEAKALQKKRGFECKEKQEADEAALKAAIEEALPVSPMAERVEKALSKIELVEQRWQEFEETKAHNVEVRKHAKDSVATWLDKLQRALTESAQLTLPAPGMK